ncbi:hypothetical protein ASD64_11415 [Mesorhizobium sp. Root157]|uniref:hypothetical protein n=1 Tax=Mesorhizobium sp. Root157 TaxID=1736477 RepID=UPI0006F6FB95|nr:hypothetical protein [Mesorhizobium sp. Root157]KQZ80893.1 hypothetical protein ASD64_11415 [Mesorhizobium sp. Root157]
MTKQQSNFPTPPPGFVMDADAPADTGAPPPPPGFELVQNASDPHNTPSSLQTWAQGLADMVTFGHSDEAAAAVGTLGGMLPGGHGKGYGQLLDEIRAENERGAEQHPYAHLSGQLMGGVGGGAAMVRGGLSLGARAAQSGGGWLARLLGVGADGGAAAAAYGFGSGEGVRDRVVSAASNIPLGIAFGVGGEAAATGAGTLYRSLFRGATDVAPGVNAAQAVKEAGEFGIPLSRGQATRSVAQAGVEDQLRSRGAMSTFDNAQREAVGQSIEGMQTRIANGGPTIPSQSAAYENIPGALRRQRDALKEAGQVRYERTVDDPNILVSGEAVREIPDFIRNRLSSENIVVDPMYHQGAARAISLIDDYISRMPKPGGDIRDVKAQLRWIENLRSTFRKNFPPIGQDAPALKAIGGALDEWTNQVFDRGLVNASDDVLRDLKDARANWSKYKQMTDPRSKIGGHLNARFEAQSKVRALMDKELSAEEVGRYLWGSSVATPAKNSYMTAIEMRRLLGADSPEWSAIRQSFWLRATRANDEALSPSQIARNLDGFLNGQGKSVAAILYNPTERDAMRSYLGVMRMLSLPKAGLNNSNTANRLMPALQRYATNIMGLLGSGAGYLAGMGPMESLGAGTAAVIAGRGLGAAARAGRVHAATRVPVPSSPGGYGSATLRSAPMPMLSDQRQRTPLEITVGVGRK